MIRRFRIADGAVDYSNRFLETDAYRYAQANGGLGYREFATDPPTGWLGRIRRLWADRTTDNACVDLCLIDDRYLATTEAPLLTEFDRETLETCHHATFAEFADTMTGHQHHDPTTGKTIGYGTTLAGSNSGYTLYSIPDGTRDVSIIGRVDRDTPGYIHSFALTPAYIVLVEPPFVPSTFRLLTVDSVINSYRWRPERGTHIHVVGRESSPTVAHYRMHAFYCFHHVNAFERQNESGAGSEIVCDLIAFEDSDIIDGMYLRNLRREYLCLPAGELRRLVIPIGSRADSAAVRSETLSPGPTSLPMINYERYNTHEYRYVYAVGNRERPPVAFQNQLVKVDTHERSVTTWSEPDTYPTEPVFVPNPTAGGPRCEDDGVVFSVVLDANPERSFLLVLDARDLSERARAWCPHSIPFGFHGHFFSDDTEGVTRSMD